MVGAGGRVYWANVIAARRIGYPWYDDFEAVARQWEFEPRPDDLGFEVDIEFVYTILPAEVRDEEIVTIFHPPATIEVRLAHVQPLTLR
jgi:hypothetical protein